MSAGAKKQWIPDDVDLDGLEVEVSTRTPTPHAPRRTPRDVCICSASCDTMNLTHPTRTYACVF